MSNLKVLYGKWHRKHIKGFRIIKVAQGDDNLIACMSKKDNAYSIMVFRHLGDGNFETIDAAIVTTNRLIADIAFNKIVEEF